MPIITVSVMRILRQEKSDSSAMMSAMVELPPRSVRLPSLRISPSVEPDAQEPRTLRACETTPWALTGNSRDGDALPLGAECELREAHAHPRGEGRRLPEPLPGLAEVRPAPARLPQDQSGRHDPGAGARRQGVHRVDADDGVHRRSLRWAAAPAEGSEAALAHALVDAVLRFVFRALAQHDRLEHLRRPGGAQSRPGGTQGGHRAHPA